MLSPAQQQMNGSVVRVFLCLLIVTYNLFKLIAPLFGSTRVGRTEFATSQHAFPTTKFD